MIKFTAQLEPVPFKRVRTNGKRHFNDARYTEFKGGLGYIALQAMSGKPPLAGAIRLHVEVYKKRRDLLKSQWGDLDNFLKAVLDSLNGICYLDDAQVKEIHAEKFIGEPRIEIELEEL